MDYHVVRVPLRTNARDEHILEQRRKAKAQLKNAVVTSLVARGRAMLRDSDYLTAKSMARTCANRTKAFGELRTKYDLKGKFDAQREAAKHWKASRWMPLVIDSRVVDAVGIEAWVEVNEWLCRNRAEPSPTPVDRQNTIWGQGDTSGLRFLQAEGLLVWPHVGSRAPETTTSAYNVNRRLHGQKRPERRGRKRGLKLQPIRRWRQGSRNWETRVGDRRIVRSGVTRQMVRGRWRWMLLLTLEGTPYRNPETSAAIQQAPHCPTGVDVNVSNIACAGPSGSTYFDLAPRADTVAAKKLKRKRQRALQRSLRNQGTSSKRAHRLRRRLSNEERRGKENRRRAANDIVTTILTNHGPHLVTEDVSVRGWQRRWGRRIATTRPAELTARLASECRLYGGQLTRIPVTLALSQLCVCGHKRPKTLGERTHHCEECDLGPVDRDLMSAFLASLVGRIGEHHFCTAVSEGTLASACGVDEATLVGILSRPTRVPSPSAPLRRNRKTSAVDGLTSVKVVCSGSNVSDQTDGTTVSPGSPAGRHGSRQRSAQDKTRVRAVSTTTFGKTETVVDIEHIS